MESNPSRGEWSALVRELLSQLAQAEHLRDVAIDAVADCHDK